MIVPGVTAPNWIRWVALIGLSSIAVTCAQGVSGGGTPQGTGGSNPNGGTPGPSATGRTNSGGTGSASPGLGGTIGGVGGASNSAGGISVVRGTGGAPSSTGGTSLAGTGGSSPIGIALPYREDFEDGVANGFVSGIDEELAPLGTWAVVTDGTTKVFREAVLTDDPSWAVGGAYQWTDQHLETRLKVVSGAAAVLIDIVVRFSGFKSYYVLEIRNDAVKIRVRTPTTQVDLVSYSFATELVDGAWYKFGLSAKGSSLAILFNDVQVAAATDATLSSGGIAFGVRDGIVEFDDLTVTQP